MEENTFNVIEISEKNGKGEIKIDETKLKGLLEYQIKRDTDIVSLTIKISVPPRNFKTKAIP